MIDSTLYDNSIYCVFQDNLLQDDENILLEDMHLNKEVSMPPEPPDTIVGMLKFSLCRKRTVANIQIKLPNFWV